MVMMTKMKMKKMKPVTFNRPRLCFRANGGSGKIWGPEVAFDSGLSFLALGGQEGTFSGSCMCSEAAPPLLCLNCGTALSLGGELRRHGRPRECLLSPSR